MRTPNDNYFNFDKMKITTLLVTVLVISVKVSVCQSEKNYLLKNNSTFFPAPSPENANSTNKTLIGSATNSTMIPLYDSVYHYWSWDSMLGTWNNSPPAYREINFVYDAANNLLSKETSYLNNFQYNHKYTYSYDGNHNKLSETDQVWNGTAWNNHYKFEYTYDSNNNMLSKTHFNGDTSSWANFRQYNYTYNLNNRLVTEISQDWFNGWQNRTLTTNTYDVNDDLINVLHQSWSASAWHNDDQQINTFDIHHNRLSLTTQDWNLNLNMWENSDQILYTYDINNNLSHELIQNWVNSAWHTSGQIIYTYDINQNLIDLLEQRFSGSIWLNSYEYTYVYNINNYVIQWDQFLGGVGFPSWHGNNYYDVNNIIQSSVNLQYSHSLTYFSGGDSAQYYYHTVTGVNNYSSPTTILISPNPFTTQLTLTFPPQTIKQATITLRNTLGQIVYHIEEKNLSPTKTINTGNLSDGIYLLEVEMDGPDSYREREVRKVVKE